MSRPIPFSPTLRCKPQKGQQRKREKRDVHGWIILDKPVGMTSTHAVAMIKRLFTAKRAGHAGTLDPLASGLLAARARRGDQDRPVRDGRPQALPLHGALGRGARYRRCRGQGRRRPPRPARTRMRSAACLPSFTGTIAQVPPKFSAIKIEGERAYDLARDGQEVALEARPVDIHGLTLTDTPDRRSCGFRGRMRQGNLCAGACARYRARSRLPRHVAALRRTQVGPFDENDMISLADLEALCQKAAAGEGSLADALLPVETALDDIPALAVNRADAARLQRGQAVLLRGRDAPIFRGTVHVTTSGELIALAEVDRGEIIPKRVFNLAGLKGSAGKRQGH